MLATSLALMLGVYATGVIRVWRSAGYGRGIRPVDALAFVCGWLALVAALSPPLDGWSEAWLMAHMAQHELLMVIAAPLIAVSAPLIALLWATPSAIRRRALDGARRRPIVAAWSAVTAPVSVFLLHGVALWVWHLPVLYVYALEHEAAHILQHLCFFGTAALFWWGIAHGRYGRLGYGAAVFYVFATAVHSGVLGALLTFSPRVWYVPYLTARRDGLTPLEDQQLAGLLMWVPGGLILAACGLALFAAWLRESDRRTRFTPTAALNRSETK
jgi:putative membrane protein